MEQPPILIKKQKPANFRQFYADPAPFHHTTRFIGTGRSTIKRTKIVLSRTMVDDLHF